MVDYSGVDRFARISILFSFVALILGGLFGILQLISRTPYMPQILSPSLYYLVLTGHGVVMALVWTTFFIMGFAAYIVSRELEVEISSGLLNIALILSIVGTIMAAASILMGEASVLYTFYAPLYASPIFYLGAGLLIFGSWVFAAAIFKAYLEWRRGNGDKGSPLATLGVITTLIVWFEASPVLVFDVLKNHLPMSLFKTPVDPMEARILFWFFGHPLVYFWILPAVAIWYYAVPRLLNVELFSVRMAKVAYVLFIIASTPVGLHHQLVDPGIGEVYKFLHVVLTFVVASPSLLTAFNVVATLERAGRRNGGDGLVGWIGKLPWGNPIFSATGLSIILFGMGGISGIINASYSLNYIVHNTTWVVGHFHLTVGAAATLTFMGASYLLLPLLFNREVYSIRAARIQPYIWFIGMFIFSLFYHIGGLYGAPRRVSSVLYGGNPPAEWVYTLQLGMIGGIIFWISGVIFIITVFATIFRGKTLQSSIDIKFTPMDYELRDRSIFDNLKVWIILAVILIVIGYSLPLAELYARGLYPYPPVTPAGMRL